MISEVACFGSSSVRDSSSVRSSKASWPLPHKQCPVCCSICHACAWSSFGMQANVWISKIQIWLQRSECCDNSWCRNGLAIQLMWFKHECVSEYHIEDMTSYLNIISKHLLNMKTTVEKAPGTGDPSGPNPIQTCGPGSCAEDLPMTGPGFMANWYNVRPPFDI